MIELKPCPFCGGEACIQEHKFHGCTSTFGVVCLDCCCETRQFYETKEQAVEAWNKRAEVKEKTTVYGYDIEQLILFAQCCKEVGITNDDLKNVEDCCRLAIDATEKAMVESFKKSYERFEIWKN